MNFKGYSIWDQLLCKTIHKTARREGIQTKIFNVALETSGSG